MLENPHVGLLFLLPGMGETLRVNGRATLTRDPELLEDLPTGGTKPPRLALHVEVAGGLPALPQGLPARRGLGPVDMDAALTSCRRRPRSTATTATRPA